MCIGRGVLPRLVFCSQRPCRPSLYLVKHGFRIAFGIICVSVSIFCDRLYTIFMLMKNEYSDITILAAVAVGVRCCTMKLNDIWNGLSARNSPLLTGITHKTNQHSFGKITAVAITILCAPAPSVPEGFDRSGYDRFSERGRTA